MLTSLELWFLTIFNCCLIDLGYLFWLLLEIETGVLYYDCKELINPSFVIIVFLPSNLLRNYRLATIFLLCFPKSILIMLLYYYVIKIINYKKLQEK